MIFGGFSCLASRRSAQRSKVPAWTSFITFLKITKIRKFSNRKIFCDVSSFYVEKLLYLLLCITIGNPIEINIIISLRFRSQNELTSQKIFRFRKNGIFEIFRNAENNVHARTFDL